VLALTFTVIYWKKFQIWTYFQNASAGHLKRCRGPHLARGPLFAHPWFKPWSSCMVIFWEIDYISTVPDSGFFPPDILQFLSCMCQYCVSKWVKSKFVTRESVIGKFLFTICFPCYGFLQTIMENTVIIDIKQPLTLIIDPGTVACFRRTYFCWISFFPEVLINHSFRLLLTGKSFKHTSIDSMLDSIVSSSTRLPQSTPSKYPPQVVSEVWRARCSVLFLHEDDDILMCKGRVNTVYCRCAFKSVDV